MYIISILGISGRNKDKAPSTCTYINTTSLGLKEGLYLNSTDALFYNFPEAKHYVLATEDAYKFQLCLFEETHKNEHKAILESSISRNFLQTNNDIDEIFGQVFEVIKSLKNSEEMIVLDITHGLRHQPLIAAFATILGRFSHGKLVNILFAKEIIQYEKYQYVLLDKYVDIGSTSIIMSSFLQTLTIPSFGYKNELIIALENFSQDLHANALSSLLENSLPRLKKLLTEYENDEAYGYMQELFTELEMLLKRFEWAKEKQDYELYYIIARIMFEKKYYLIAATYIYEAIPRYFISHFQQLGLLNMRIGSHYEISTAVNAYISGEKINPKILNIPSKYFYCSNLEILTQSKQLLGLAKEVRNNIAHINPQYSNDDLQKSIEGLLDLFWEQCLDDNILKNLTLKKAKEQKKCIEHKTVWLKKLKKYFDDEFFLKISEDEAKFKETIKKLSNNDLLSLNLPQDKKTHLQNSMENNAKFKAIFQQLEEYAQSSTIDYDKFHLLLKD